MNSMVEQIVITEKTSKAKDIHEAIGNPYGAIFLAEGLAQRGMKKGDLSKFIEDAVRWRVLDQTVAEARASFADLPPDALQAIIDEAVEASRPSR